MFFGLSLRPKVAGIRCCFGVSLISFFPIFFFGCRKRHFHLCSSIQIEILFVDTFSSATSSARELAGFSVSIVYSCLNRNTAAIAKFRKFPNMVRHSPLDWERQATNGGKWMKSELECGIMFHTKLPRPKECFVVLKADETMETSYSWSRSKMSLSDKSLTCFTRHDTLALEDWLERGA